MPSKDKINQIFELIFNIETTGNTTSSTYEREKEGKKEASIKWFALRLHGKSFQKSKNNH